MKEYDEIDPLSDKNLDIFRKEYPDHIRNIRKAVLAIHDLNVVSDKDIRRTALTFGVDKDKLKAVTYVTQRVHNATSGYIIPNFPTRGKYDYKTYDIVPMTPQFSLLVDIVKRYVDDDFMDNTNKAFWGARWRSVVAHIAANELGLKNKEIAEMTGWPYSMASQGKVKHPYLVGRYSYYRQIYTTVLETLKTELSNL